MNITIHIHRTAGCLPDADTDVLVWEEGWICGLTQSSAAPALLVDNGRTPAGVRCNAGLGPAA